MLEVRLKGALVQPKDLRGCSQVGMLVGWGGQTWHESSARFWFFHAGNKFDVGSGLVSKRWLLRDIA